MVKNILIVTGTGGILGQGHFQRMLNLAVHLNQKSMFSAKIYLTQNNSIIEDKFKKLLTSSISENTGLIIRDMRDSSIDEMNRLRLTAPVLTIDDSGKGKDCADFTISLLPLPADILNYTKPETSLFLYGYNFAEGISLLQNNESFIKDIDITVYAGYNPPSELISLIKRSIPESASSVLLKKGKPVNLNGEILKSETSYAETISRSKIVLTHFGLTMFEADVCGCKIAALNPTSYHSRLTDIITTDFNVIYSAEYSSLSTDNLKIAIDNELQKNTDEILFTGDILKKINNGTENFINYIKTII